MNLTMFNVGASRGRWRSLLLAGACLAAVFHLGTSRARGPATPAECKTLQAKYPALQGKTLTNAIIRIRRAMRRSIRTIRAST